MTAVRVFTVEASTPAPAARVYALLDDAPSWSRWAGPLITHATWETPPGSGSVAPVRRLGRRPFLVREEIVAAEEPSRHAYRLLSGQPVRSYEAEVRISEEATPGAGTRIVWTGRVVPLFGWAGLVTERLFTRMIAGFARRVAAAATAAEQAEAGVAHPD